MTYIAVALAAVIALLVFSWKFNTLKRASIVIALMVVLVAVISYMQKAGV